MIGVIVRPWRKEEWKKECTSVQSPKWAGNCKVGPKQCVGIQNNMGSSVREEGAKQVMLSDIQEGSLGRQTGKCTAQKLSPDLGKRAAQNLSPNLETIVGQSPTRLRDQIAWPIEGKAWNVDKEKRMGMGGEKTKGTDDYSLVSPQRGGDKVAEAKEIQENTLTQTVGQQEINNRERVISRKEGMIPREAKGKQNEEKGRSFMGSDRDSLSGEFLRDTLSFSVEVVGGLVETSTAGEKRQRSLQAGDCLCNIQVERAFKFSSCPPSTPGEISKELGQQVEEAWDIRVGREARSVTEELGQQEVTRPVSLGRVQEIRFVSQEQKYIKSDRVYGADSGTGSIDGSDLGSGRILSRTMELGHDRLDPSPSKPIRPTPDGSNRHKGFETEFAGEENGLIQYPVLRLPMNFEGRVSNSSESNIAEEGNKDISREEGEIREDLSKDDDCVDMERYVDNFNDQSPSSRFSVFGRPLLPGGFSGPGGPSGLEDMELMRKEAEDDMAWGRVAADESIAAGEEARADGRRVKEAQHDSTGNWKYDSWESSSLAKFSEFLGFPTKGFEKEILELLRNLVVSIKSGKEKGNTTVTKSERELKRLKSTINYNGKQTNKGGGRDKGTPQIKF